MKLKLLSILTLALLIYGGQAYSQNSYPMYIGVSAELFADVESIDESLLFHGFFIEKKISKGIGLESGYFFKKIPRNGKSYHSIPVGIRFHLGSFTLTGGGSFDFASKRINEYFTGLDFGVFARLSKSISLAERFFLEPSIAFNHQVEQVGNYLGLGFRLKYIL